MPPLDPGPRPLSPAPPSGPPDARQRASHRRPLPPRGATLPVAIALLLPLLILAGCFGESSDGPAIARIAAPEPAGGAAGACCFFDGSCVVLPEDDCLAQEGTWLGEGLACDPNPCAQPDPTGACCFASGYCELYTADECAGAGGVYGGDGTVCDPNPCAAPPPTGACCFANGRCAVRTAADCDQEGGIFSGENTTCEPRACQVVVEEGCGASYWRSHRQAWKETPYRPTHPVGRLFTLPPKLRAMAGDRLLSALYYPNGPGVRGGARILLRAAVVGVLNASHPRVNYPISQDELISRTNAALASLDRAQMVALAREIRTNNRLGCPLRK